MITKCKICGGPLKGKQKIFCSKPCTCKDYYLNNTKKRINSVKQWQKVNPDKVAKIRYKSVKKYIENKPEKFKKLMKKQYEEQKPRWRVRGVINQKRKQLLKQLGNKCQDCGKRKKNLIFSVLDYNWVKNEFGQNSLKLNMDKFVLICLDCRKIRRQNNT